MLDIRENMEECLKFYKTNAFCERTKHELLLLRFATFKDQYNTKSFNSSYLEKEVQSNTEFLLKDLKENRIGCDMNSTKSLSNELRAQNTEEFPKNINDHEMFPFNRLAGCEYHDVIIYAIYVPSKLPIYSIFRSITSLLIKIIFLNVTNMKCFVKQTSV